MNEQLPKFKYHPDPIKTGSIVKSEQPCWCCNQKRGYLSALGGYTEFEFDEELLNDFIEEQSHLNLRPNLLVCPWCIHDGSAAKKWKAHFTPVDEMMYPDLSDEIIEELQERTPSFVARQEERWLVHCNDGCEFHGDATVEDLRELTWEEVQQIEDIQHLVDNVEEWEDFLNNVYAPKSGDKGFYKFVCRHCRKKLYYWDCF